MLQPIEELRNGHAKPIASIEADYSSLPPQLVIIKALRSSHFKLASVCLMALFANVLAVAFAAMFYEQTVLLPHTSELYYPLSSRFVMINGSVGPHIDSREEGAGLIASGAYRGGDGTDMFLAAESHYAANNSLPAWTDSRFMYMPFAPTTATSKSLGLEARTQAFGATIDCKKIPSRDYSARATLVNIMRETMSNSTFSMTTDDGTGRRVTCGLERRSLEPGPIGRKDSLGLASICYDGTTALELVLPLKASENATQSDKDFCARTRFLGFAREKDPCSREVKFDDKNAVFMACRPRLIAGAANVFIDQSDRVRNASQVDVTSDLSKDFMDKHFSNDAANMLEQADRYIYRFGGGLWHNDSFANDMLNYFIVKSQNDTRLLDPNTPLPTVEDVTKRLKPVYSSLFAIWLGLNKDRLFIENTQATAQPIIGHTTGSHIRIFLSTPMFIIAEVILIIYALVAFAIWFRRPGRFLLRMPTNISAVIALFAASSAIIDMEGTSRLSKTKRRKHLDDLGHTYGYGTFVGTDGDEHVGIEREPLIKTAPIPGVLEKVATGFTKTSTGLTNLSKSTKHQFTFGRRNHG